MWLFASNNNSKELCFPRPNPSPKLSPFKVEHWQCTSCLLETLCSQTDNTGCLLDVRDKKSQTLTLFLFPFAAEDHFSFVAPAAYMVHFCYTVSRTQLKIRGWQERDLNKFDKHQWKTNAQWLANIMNACVHDKETNCPFAIASAKNNDQNIFNYFIC